MKSVVLFFITFLSFALYNQQNDTLPKLNMIMYSEYGAFESKTKVDSTYINYYILNHVDTVYFSNKAVVWECNYLHSIEKSYNKCTMLSFGKPITAHVSYYILYEDSSIVTFTGNISGGKYIDGDIIKYYSNGQIKLTGQYSNNWKVGGWTMYYKNGIIEYVGTYVKDTNEPLEEREYNKKGNLIFIKNKDKWITIDY